MFCSLPLVQQQIPCSVILSRIMFLFCPLILHIFCYLPHIMQLCSCYFLFSYNNAHFISTTMFMICSHMFQFHQERGCCFLGSSQGDGRAREGEMAGEAEEDVHEEVRTEARTFAEFQDTRRGQ